MNTEWLMRVPETLAEAKRLVKETDRGQMVELAPGYFGKQVKSNYGGVDQRWLVVFSQAASERKLKTLGKTQAREREAVEKQWRYEVGVEEAKRSLGKFIIATNELDAQNISPVAMLENYTAQGVSAERGFRFLKDPMFFAHSLFLKNPARIMALIMIMGLALLIFALGERQLRQALKQNNETIPDQKGKPTQTPTLRWVFQIFEGLDVLSVWADGRLVTRQFAPRSPADHSFAGPTNPEVLSGRDQQDRISDTLFLSISTGVNQ